MKSPALEVKLSNALLNLLTQTSYQQISVKKICQEAQVNRTSFYLCFNNLDDCLKFTFNRFLEPFYSSLKQAFVVKEKIGHDKAIHYFQQILQPLKQVQQILESNDHEVQDKFLQLIREISFKCL